MGQGDTCQTLTNSHRQTNTMDWNLRNSSQGLNLHPLASTFPGAPLMHGLAHQSLGWEKRVGRNFSRVLQSCLLLVQPERSQLRAARESGELRVISSRHSRSLPSAFQRPFTVWGQSIRVERFPKAHKARAGMIEQRGVP